MCGNIIYITFEDHVSYYIRHTPDVPAWWARSSPQTVRCLSLTYDFVLAKNYIYINKKPVYKFTIKLHGCGIMMVDNILPAGRIWFSDKF